MLAGIGISVITLAELLYGAFRSHEPTKSLKHIHDFIDRVEANIIDLKQEAVYVFSKIKFDLEKSGQKLEDFDLLIAATALSLDLVLVTRNTKHFKRIKQLRLQD